MRLKLLSSGALLGAIAALAAPPASASYMENCKALIADWDACRTKGEACKSEQEAIETECKCHAQKGDEWELVMAAVGKDNVCETEWPPTDIPDSSPPPHETRDNPGSEPEVRTPN
ncbi:MAG: hypothetical protein MRY64_01895 [Hyphomonadaceae bacterium]|nr:hypothetical protein [Hyphomonadaceae bacterium]